MLPYAITYGMSIDDFWYNYEYLFEVYMKSYNERVDREMWLQGVYFAKALESSILSYMPLAIAQGTGLSKANYEPVQYPSNPICTSRDARVAQAELSEDAKREKETAMLNHWL